MITDAMVSGVQALRPAVPAKDYALSQRFYTTLGFRAVPTGPQLTAMHLGPFSFFLQDFWVQDWAWNFVMHLTVDDVDAWWPHVVALKLADTFDVRAPLAPKVMRWGMKTLHVFDPAGVLWQIASRP